MKTQETSVVGTKVGPHHNRPDYDSCRELFQNFRKLFGVKNQSRRVIFWIERQGESFVVRQVVNLQRQRKGEDRVVGKTKNTIDAVRVTIGNFAAGAAMTLRGWELYDDFSLSQLVDAGRFDVQDLLPNADKLSEVRRTDLGIAGDWDFDSLLLTHQCPHCLNLYNEKSVIYTTLDKCSQCGQEPGIAKSSAIVCRLINKFVKAESIASHPREASGSFPIQDFVDPLPNSVVYWVVTASAVGYYPFGLDSVIPLNQQEAFRRVYRSSLFKFMTSANVKKMLEKHLDAIGAKDKEFAIAFFGRLGESLERENSDLFREHTSLDARRYMQVSLPLFINDVINSSVRSENKSNSSINTPKEIS